MIVIGLTGSIGMGKSTVAAMFRALGVPVFDADETVHRLQQPPSPVLALIEARFPRTTSKHGLDRAKLSAAVFGQPAALKALESIIHPAVAHERGLFLCKHRGHRVVVLDIPLLLEKQQQDRVDIVLVVSAPAWQQRRRVLARPGMTAAKFRAICAHQMSDRHKRALADVIIDTGASLDRTRASVRQFVACIRVPRSQYGRHARNHIRHRNHRPLSRER